MSAVIYLQRWIGQQAVKLQHDSPCWPASLRIPSLISFKENITLAPLCGCADAGVQQCSHTYRNLCMSIVAIRLLELCICFTNLTNFIPFGVWWLIRSTHIEQGVKNCRRQISPFPLVPYVPLSHTAQSFSWHDSPIDWFGVSWCPSPGLAARTHWLFTLLLHQQSICDPSLFPSHVFQLQQYIACLKNIGKYICVLCRNSWVCLYSWVHVWRWGIELFTACLRPWWLNWDLLLYLPGRRGSGGWGGESLTERGRAVSLCSTAGSIVDAIINHL